VEFLPEGRNIRRQRDHLDDCAGTNTPAFKTKVTLAAVRGDRTIARPEHFDVHLNQITAWKAQLEGGASGVFGGKQERLPKRDC
jgi:hypothetical protein